MTGKKKNCITFFLFKNFKEYTIILLEFNYVATDSYSIEPLNKREMDIYVE